MRPVPFSTLADNVLALYVPPMAAKATLRQMRQVLREFAEVGVKRCLDLDDQAVAQWIAHHAQGSSPRSPARTESLLRCLHVVCVYAQKKKWLKITPFDIKPLKRWVRADCVPAKRVSPPRRKTVEEIVRLLRLLEREAGEGSWRAGRLQALVNVYVYTGLRRDEALHLLAANVDLSGLTLTVEPIGDWKPKTVRSARTIPLADPLAEVLARWTPRCGSRWLFPGHRLKSPWSGGMHYKPIDQILRGRRAGRHPGHDLDQDFPRHSRHRGQAGSPPLEMQTLLGHADSETQRWYDEEQVHSMRPAMKRLAELYSFGT